MRIGDHNTQESTVSICLSSFKALHPHKATPNVSVATQINSALVRDCVKTQVMGEIL